MATTTTSGEKPNIIYINVTVHDASLAVRDRVSQKFPNSPKLLQKQAAHVANYFNTPNKVAPILSERLCKEVAEKLAGKGICAVVEEIFREGPYIVLKLEVVRVDSQVLGQRSIVWLSNNLGFKEKIEDNLLPKLVKKQLKEVMPAIIENRIALNKISAESIVFSEKKQVPYFDSKIKELEAGRKRNLLRRRQRRKIVADERQIQQKSTYVTERVDEVKENVNTNRKIKHRLSFDSREKEVRKMKKILEPQEAGTYSSKTIWIRRSQSIGSPLQSIESQVNNSSNSSKSIWGLSSRRNSSSFRIDMTGGISSSESDENSIGSPLNDELENEENQSPTKWWTRTRSMEKEDSNSSTIMEEELIQETPKVRRSFWNCMSDGSFDIETNQELRQ